MKSYKYPSPIKPNSSTIAVFSASAPDAEKNPKELKRGISWLKRQGYKVIEASTLRQNAGRLSASPEKLARDLSHLVGDPTVDAVFCAGGGMNANELLPFIDYEALAKHPKPILGLSNPSILLNAITAKSRIVTFHGPAVIWNMGAEAGLDDFTTRHLWRALATDEPKFELDQEKSWKWLRGGVVKGRLFGGNLWSMQQLIGTPYSPDLRGAVLFIEDCFCQIHQVAAILTHFKTAGLFDRLNGVIIGVFESVEEKEYLPMPTIEELVVNNIPAEIPILMGVHLGHTESKVTLPIGALCEMDSKRNRVLISKC